MTRHKGRDRTGRYATTLRCDACGGGIGTDSYCTDDDVCGGTDGPGFFLCGKRRCVATYEHLSVEERRTLYTAQRARNDARKGR